MPSHIESRRLLALTLISVVGLGTPAHAEPSTDIGLAIASQGNLALQKIRADAGRDAREQLADRLGGERLAAQFSQQRQPATASLIAGPLNSLTDRNAQASLAR